MGKRDMAAWEWEVETVAAGTARVLVLLLAQAQHGRGAVVPGELVGRGRVFECKTCGRQFPTFQALGGHRASYKRPRPLQQQPTDHAGLCLGRQPLLPPPPQPRQARPRVHECGVCGLQFATGQALGGHMRRHRTEADEGGEAPVKLPAPEKACDVAGGICLDLNLTPSDNCAKCRNVIGLGAAGQGVHKALAILDCTL
ncbi:hypothetical protein ACP70R_036471 [Stipagrostis hirtigluma subsp. patula]